MQIQANDFSLFKLIGINTLLTLSKYQKVLAGNFYTYTEEQLIKAVRKRNMLAFKFLVEKFEDDVAKTVIGMLGNVAEADDVGQEVFIRFYNSINKFRGDSSIKTYLIRIAINLSLNELKRRKAKRWLSFEDSYHETKSIKDEYKDSDLKEVVHLALNELEIDFRSVLVLRLLQGYSTRETAIILKLPEGTVLSRLSRGQKKLKQIILNMERI